MFEYVEIVCNCSVERPFNLSAMIEGRLLGL